MTFIKHTLERMTAPAPARPHEFAWIGDDLVCKIYEKHVLSLCPKCAKLTTNVSAFRCDSEHRRTHADEWTKMQNTVYEWMTNNSPSNWPMRFYASRDHDQVFVYKESHALTIVCQGPDCGEPVYGKQRDEFRNDWIVQNEYTYDHHLRRLSAYGGVTMATFPADVRRSTAQKAANEAVRELQSAELQMATDRDNINNITETIKRMQCELNDAVATLEQTRLRVITASASVESTNARVLKLAPRYDE